jgi:hypothetical protein
MDNTRKFMLLAVVCLVISVPLWYTILAPGEFSLGVFTDPGLIIAFCVALVSLYIGFSVNRPSREKDK